MNNKRVAFPSTINGLNGELSFHFGHALAFTIIEFNPETKNVVKIEVIKNVSHQHGKCMRPINLLVNSAIDAIVVGMIGKGAIQGFRQVNIAVCQGFEGTVKENFKALLNEGLEPINSSIGCPQKPANN